MKIRTLTDKQKDLLRETIDTYIDPSKRSIRVESDTGNKRTVCLYNGPDNKSCGYARLLKPEHRKNLKEGARVHLPVANTSGYNDLGVDPSDPHIYIEGYEGFDILFYQILQYLHDTVLGSSVVQTILHRETEEKAVAYLNTIWRKLGDFIYVRDEVNTLAVQTIKKLKDQQ